MVMRFDRLELLQHLVLTVSFTVLVVTGFGLRFPEAWWVEWLSKLGMGEPVRSTVHRVAAVVLILTAVCHVLRVMVAERGRIAFRAMAPRAQDFRDLVDNIRYHTWRSDRRVRFGRYNYMQKAEYWALVWGMVLMAVTGLVLWFPEQAVRFFPALIVTASQTIHYYEALLSTLVVVVWHLFFVIYYYPDAYPVRWRWLTGKMAREHARKHHPRWLEEEVEGTQD